MGDLGVPLTEIEKAELLEACRDFLTPHAQLLLRRVLYQLDAPKEIDDKRREYLIALLVIYNLTFEQRRDLHHTRRTSTKAL